MTTTEGHGNRMPPAEHSSEDLTKRHQLLLVDDDPLISDTLEFVLREHFDVSTQTRQNDFKKGGVVQERAHSTVAVLEVA